MSAPRHLLLAEDDENDVFFMRRAFRDAGIVSPVQVVRDGQEAIEYLGGEGIYGNREKYPFPSILILDLKMPRKSGMDVLAWLRHQPFLKALPVMILSSSANRFDVERAYFLWVNAFVTKPVDTQKRAIVVGIIKELWLTLNLLPAVCAEGLEGAKAIYDQPNFPSMLL